MEVVNALGRRKRAVARVFVSEGTGKITSNKRDLAQYFPSTILQYVVKQPLNKLEAAEKYDIKVIFTVVVLQVSHRLCVWLSPVRWLKSTLKIKQLFVQKAS